ncbi:hypothetical protein AB0K35_27775 [Micromonospora sp. NPDC053740]
MGRKEMVDQVRRDDAQLKAAQDAKRDALRDQVRRDDAQRRAKAK